MQVSSHLSTTKTIAIALAVVLASFSSFSQRNRFSISINSLTTNFNYGKANGALKPYKKDFRGLTAGVSYQAGISSMFSVVPELYFAVKGGTLKENNTVTISKSTVRLHTIEMPVLARLHCKNLYLNGGPYITYAVGGRIKTESMETTPGTSSRISFGKQHSDYKRWDTGIQVGAGYNFNMKKTILTLDLRYGYGFVSVSKDIERYNRMFHISLLASTPGRT
jgi:hypothetical protein